VDLQAGFEPSTLNRTIIGVDICINEGKHCSRMISLTLCQLQLQIHCIKLQPVNFFLASLSCVWTSGRIRGTVTVVINFVLFLPPLVVLPQKNIYHYLILQLTVVSRHWLSYVYCADGPLRSWLLCYAVDWIWQCLSSLLNLVPQSVAALLIVTRHTSGWLDLSA